MQRNLVGHQAMLFFEWASLDCSIAESKTLVGQSRDSIVGLSKASRV
jgi:hypothetical protein